uniref:Peptidase M14 domain-containing protein n=1 Tax=Anopheles funestus TaxID=62324 RepID=A0A182RH96_ANOFN
MAPLAGPALASFTTLLTMMVLMVHDVHAVSGIYVNNHKIDKFETDRVKLIRPSDSQTQESTSYVNKNGLLTKDNFTTVQQYYQYLVGEDPVNYIDLLWGKNKTQLPSIFRIGGVSSANYHFTTTASPTALNYSDDQSPIKNTLNNTNLAYYGDYQRPQSAQSSVVTALPLRQPVSTIRSPTNPTRKRRKKKPADAVVPSKQQVSHPAGHSVIGVPPSDLTTAELTPETLSLLSRYYSFSCTLTPIQPAPSAYPTPSTVPPSISTTRRTKTRYLTTKPTVKTATKRPKPSTVTSGVKQKKPVVYVDPPVIKRIGGMLESVYTFMENALTSTEYVEDSAETRAAKQRTNMPNQTTRNMANGSKSAKVKRNTYTKASFEELEYVGSTSGELDSASRATLADTEQTWLPVASDGTSKITKQFTPKLVTISGLPSTLSTDGNKNKMTTNIQVTSEYTAATPPTVTHGKPRPDDSADYDDSSEEESEEDYFDGFGGFGEVDDEDDDDEEDEDDSNDEQYGDGSNGPVRPNRQTALTNDKDYEDVGTHVERPVRIKRVKRRRRKKRPAVSYESTSEYSDEDSSDEVEDEYDERNESNGEEEEDDDDYDSGEAPEDAEGFFSRMFSTFGRFVRSLGFGAAARGTPNDYDDYDGGNARSTTPRVQSVRRRPTRSTSGDASPVTPNRQTMLSPEGSPINWFGMPGAYLLNDIEEEAAVDQLVPPVEFPAVTAPSTSTTNAGWFELMMPWDFFNPWTSGESSGDVEEQELPATIPPVTVLPQIEQQTTPTASSPMSSWLSQFFVGSTTKPPTSTTALPKPDQLLSALAQYVAQTASTKRPTEAGLVHTTKHPTRPVSYTNYQLWRIFIHTENHLQRLEEYRQSPDGIRLQWWSSPSLVRPTDVLVPPTGVQADSLREFLEEEGLRYETTIRDVGQAIAYENPRLTRREQMEMELLHGHPLTWYRYHRYGDIVKFVHYLQRRHPQHVQLLHIGRSYEGRPVTVVRVSYATQQPKRSRKPSKKRPAVFVEAGAHGHEWIGPAVATWLLNRLLELPDTLHGNSTPPTESVDLKTVQSYDWYVLPVLNPDGYEYSHRRDRLWSKNRSNQTQHTPSGVGQAILSSAINWWNAHKPQLTEDAYPEESCYGVDLNRNWAYHWQQASDPMYRNPCSDSYAGTEPFSEPETRALRDFLLTRRRNVRLYLSLQAYGQVLTYPDTDSITTRDKERYGPEAFGDVHEMASAGLEAMRGEAGEFLYNLEPEAGPLTYGTATGYARHGAGIRYSYTLRLPDKGTHGLLLPPSSIVPIGRDVFELLKGMIEYS